MTWHSGHVAPDRLCMAFWPFCSRRAVHGILAIWLWTRCAWHSGHMAPGALCPVFWPAGSRHAVHALLATGLQTHCAWHSCQMAPDTLCMVSRIWPFGSRCAVRGILAIWLQTHCAWHSGWPYSSRHTVHGTGLGLGGARPPGYSKGSPVIPRPLIRV